MIRITKSKNIPKALSGTGSAETTSNLALYDAAPSAYDSGKAKFDIKSGIYGEAKVKAQLISEQFGKCCFCEADFTANGYGDVEHFRPKAGYKQTRTQKTLSKPGYYWLAYAWENLLFSCQICNQRYKKNYFPLADNAKRAKTHHDSIADETPLLLHPCQANPEHHIKFHRHIPVAKDSPGDESIYAFGIGRRKLNEAREKYYDNVQNNIMLAKLDLTGLTQADKDRYSHDFALTWAELEDIILKAKAFVAIAAKPQSPFAAMVRANFPHLPT